jgi:sulfoxide reductase heme-binding subunit YedZ
LCLVLTVTPLRVITDAPALARFRRMLGLFVYFYVAIHLLSYSWF